MTPDVQLLDEIKAARAGRDPRRMDTARGELWMTVEAFADTMAGSCARKFPGLGDSAELFGELYTEFLRVVERLEAKPLPADQPWIVRRYLVISLKNHLLSLARKLRAAGPVQITDDLAAPESESDAFAQVDLYQEIAPEVERRLRASGKERDARYWRWRIEYVDAPDADFARLVDVSNKTAMETRLRVYALAQQILLERHPDLADRVADFRNQSRRGPKAARRAPAYSASGATL